MRNLYLLLLFSLGALLWAAFSIARHIRKHARQQALMSSAEEHKFEEPQNRKSSEVAKPASTSSSPDEALKPEVSSHGSQP